MAGGDPAPGHRAPDPVRQPAAHARLCGHESRRSMDADRGTGGAFYAAALCLLPPLAGRRFADLGRARDDAPWRRRLRTARAADHAAHDRLLNTGVGSDSVLNWTIPVIPGPPSGRNPESSDP